MRMVSRVSSKSGRTRLWLTSVCAQNNEPPACCLSENECLRHATIDLAIEAYTARNAISGDGSENRESCRLLNRLLQLGGLIKCPGGGLDARVCVEKLEDSETTVPPLEAYHFLGRIAKTLIREKRSNQMIELIDNLYRSIFSGQPCLIADDILDIMEKSFSPPLLLFASKRLLALRRILNAFRFYAVFVPKFSSFAPELLALLQARVTRSNELGEKIAELIKRNRASECESRAWFVNALRSKIEKWRKNYKAHDKNEFHFFFETTR